MAEASKTCAIYKKYVRKEHAGFWERPNPFGDEAGLQGWFFSRKQDLRFPSFPRQRESSHPLKKLDTRFRGYDEFKGFGENPGKNDIFL
jgi:hypothetical protein